MATPFVPLSEKNRKTGCSLSRRENMYMDIRIGDLGIAY